MHNAAVRLSVFVLVALLVNIALFTTIQYLVVNRQFRLADTTQFDIANFIRMAERPREVSSRRDPKAPKKPDAEAQQDIERLARATKAGGLAGLSVDVPNIEFDVGVDVGGGIQIARELTPLVRIPPEYPIAAAKMGREGVVLVRFTVTETGSVADPEIMQSDPPGVFDRAAIRAVLKWKYQPQLVNGEPVSVVSYTRFRFEQIVDD
jgi:protein TonB